MKLKPFYLFVLATFFSISISYSQIKNFNESNITNALNAQGNSHGLLKTALIISTKGYSFGFSYGMWHESERLQYSLNTGIIFRGGKRFLGNYRNIDIPDDSRSRGQLNLMFCPMLTVNLGSKNYYYQEIEPFYLGTPNAVYFKYKYSFTLGSTIVAAPRGTSNNIYTTRNRSQQVCMVAFNIKDLNFTIIDDYLPFLITEGIQLGDNFDRFFTGGGFLRYRFSENYIFHIYSEIYTGLNRPNYFLNGDLMSYRHKNKKWFRQNYANQDPGQEYFNYSWFIGKLTYTGSGNINKNPNNNIPDYDIFIGHTADWTIYLQNVIHNFNHIDRGNGLNLHHFLHRALVPGNSEAGQRNTLKAAFKNFFIGGGIKPNIL